MWALGPDRNSDHDIINRELARLPRAEAQQIVGLVELLGFAILDAIDSGRHRPQQRAAASREDQALLDQQMTARGITIADTDAMGKGTLPPSELCDKALTILESIASLPDQAQRFRVWTNVLQEML